MNYKIQNPKTALLLLAIFAFTSGFLSTYLGSMITTLEKRFNWPTVQIGWLISSADIGYLLTVMCVAYYGGKGRQSFVLSISAFGLFLSVVVFILPIFIWGPKYKPEQILFNSTLAYGSNTSYLESNIDTSISSTESIASFAIQFLGGLLNGCAATPFWNVGMSLIDDMSGRNSGIFLGILFLIRTLSPIFGFLFGGFMTTINEGLILVPTDFFQGLLDPRWIGAWWLGYLILGVCVLINCPFLALLDAKKLQEAGEKDLEALRLKRQKYSFAVNSYMGHSMTSLNEPPPVRLDMAKLGLAEFFVEIRLLFTNSVFWFLYMGTVCEIGAFMILLTYFPKYIESHFHFDAKSANLMSSLSLAGGSAVAVILSSIISKACPMTMTQMNAFHTIVNVIAAILFPILLAFKCPTIDVIGMKNSTFGFPVESFSCLDWSSCSSTVYSPVCVDGKNFKSACFAGCTQLNRSTAINCLCSNESASFGVCPSQCDNVYFYLIVFFLTRVIGSMATVQFTQVVMRLPGKKDLKPLAISCITLLWGFLGVVTPPLAGKIIDTVCTLHNSDGFCLFYDTDNFRILIHTIGSLFQIPSSIFFGLAWWKSKTVYPDEKDPVFLLRQLKAQASRNEEEMQRMTSLDEDNTCISETNSPNR